MRVTPELAVTTLGLAAALTWGAGDFSGGLATRQGPVFGVVIVSYVMGAVLLVTLALLRSEPLPSAASLGWAVAAGCSGVVGLVTLWRALAVGKMGLAAPITGVVAAIVPVLFATFTEGWPTTVQVAGFGLGLTGVWLGSQREESQGRPEGFGLTIVAGLGFGAYFILIDHAGAVTVLWPLVTARATSLVIALTIALSGRAGQFPRSGLLPLALLAGVLDASGNLFFVLAAQLGRLDVSAVLSSLYPVVTILLARLFLGERLTRMQVAGIAAALVAIPLINVR